MIKYSELLILDLRTTDNKKITGQIVNVFFSKKFNKVDGLIIKNDKLYNNKVLLPMSNIIKIDTDSIYLEKGYDLNKEKSYEGKELNLNDWEVMTTKLEFIGYVKDILISKDNGEILGFVISEGLIEDILKGRNFLSFSDIKEIEEDFIIIKKEETGGEVKNKQSYKKIIELED